MLNKLYIDLQTLIDHATSRESRYIAHKKVKSLIKLYFVFCHDIIMNIIMMGINEILIHHNIYLPSIVFCCVWENISSGHMRTSYLVKLHVKTF